GMRPMPVVVVQPRNQGLGALCRVGIGTGVGPFAQAGLNQPLSLAVGAGGVGACAKVAHAEAAGQAAEAAGSVARAVVGEDALEAHAQAPVVADRSQQGLAGADTAFVGFDGAEGHA